MPPTDTPEPSPTETRPAEPPPTGQESEIVREILAVTAVVRRYLTAVTNQNEAEAARFTCRKTDGGLL